MRVSRIYTPQPLFCVESVELEKQASHYLLRVLRLAGGDTVILFNGDGSDYPGEISGTRGQRVQVRLRGNRLAGNESPLKITLVQAVSRGERMDNSIQKATELGVFCIRPVISRRVEVRLDAKRLARRMTHWQGVVTSACEQSGRAVVPGVVAPVTLAEWAAEGGESPRLVLDPDAETRLSSFPIAGESVSLLVGPEGGFEKDELANLHANGVTAVSLGPRVLRTETAGPAAIAVLQAGLGDF